MEEVVPILRSCTISEEHNSGFFMDRFEDYRKQQQHLVFPHRHQFYHFVFFTRAKGSYSIDFDNFEAQDWSVYFMAPGQIHTWDLDSDTTGFVVNVESLFFESFLYRSDYLDKLSFFNGVSKDGTLYIPVSKRPIIQQSFEELWTIYQDEMHASSDLLRAYLLVVLQRLAKLDHPNNDAYSVSSTNPVKTLQRFQDLIEKHFRFYHFPKQYAEILNISSNHLNNLCRIHLGRQAAELIRSRILLECKRLMVISGLSISEIAYHLNFKDNSYFTKFFKKHTGMTPEEFRHHKNDNIIQ